MVCRGGSKRAKYTCGFRGGGTNENGNALVRKPLMLDAFEKTAPAKALPKPPPDPKAAALELGTAMTGPLLRFSEKEL